MSDDLVTLRAMMEKASEARTSLVANHSFYRPCSEQAAEVARLENELRDSAVNALPDLLSRIEALEGAVKAAAAQFRDYERSHMEKAASQQRVAGQTAIPRLDKAARNREMADMCERAIGQGREG
jgi:hypothetical protein